MAEVYISKRIHPRDIRVGMKVSPSAYDPSVAYDVLSVHKTTLKTKKRSGMNGVHLVLKRDTGLIIKTHLIDATHGTAYYLVA